MGSGLRLLVCPWMDIGVAHCIEKLTYRLHRDIKESLDVTDKSS